MLRQGNSSIVERLLKLEQKDATSKYKDKCNSNQPWAVLMDSKKKKKRCDWLGLSSGSGHNKTKLLRQAGQPGFTLAAKKPSHRRCPPAWAVRLHCRCFRLFVPWWSVCWRSFLFPFSTDLDLLSTSLFGSFALIMIN